LTGERLSDYPHSLTIPTRWKDNDVYGHVNNVEYYTFFDTVIGAWLMAEGGLDYAKGEVYGVCAESHCAYHAAIAFPDVVEAGLRVGHLGRSSVRYEIGIFCRGGPEVSATGWFVHVFLGRETGRPSEIPQKMRAALQRLVTAPPR
jgi:acyl-CoA thioester hydrolase